MGVQIGIAVARVVVVERRGGQTLSADLADAAGAGPGKGGVLFQQFERGVLRVLVCLSDRIPDPRPLIQRPQRAQRQ